jgi:hypothetical protein
MLLENAPNEASLISPVLCLAIGQSGLRRLAELAQLEGVDASTLATNMVMYEIGQRTARARAGLTRRPAVDGVNPTAVCLACGRERQHAGQVRCSVCGGSWTMAVR